MEESNDVLRNSTTFLTPGVNEVVKTFPSESFSLRVQLKSFDEVWNFSSSERVPTSLSRFSTMSCKFSILLIFSWRVNSLTTTGFSTTVLAGITAIVLKVPHCFQERTFIILFKNIKIILDGLRLRC